MDLVWGDNTRFYTGRIPAVGGWWVVKEFSHFGKATTDLSMEQIVCLLRRNLLISGSHFLLDTLILRKKQGVANTNFKN